MAERMASSVIQGLNCLSAPSSSPRNSIPAGPPRLCVATLGDRGVQPISAAWRTIGNCTEPASVILVPLIFCPVLSTSSTPIRRLTIHQ